MRVGLKKSGHPVRRCKAQYTNTLTTLRAFVRTTSPLYLIQLSSRDLSFYSIILNKINEYAVLLLNIQLNEKDGN
jgi:hypothetical protein